MAAARVPGHVGPGRTTAAASAPARLPASSCAAADGGATSSGSCCIFVPVAIYLGLTHASPTWVFLICCLAILPLAGLMGEATEHITHHTGPGIGGLLNASFGNAAELIIAFIALRAGETRSSRPRSRAPSSATC